MDKIKKHVEICKELNNIYRAKNADYGDSFGDSYKNFGLLGTVIRLTDKVNRLRTLCCTDKQEVKEESIRDTLIDAANYAIMTLIELDKDKDKENATTIKATLYVEGKPVETLTIKETDIKKWQDDILYIAECFK